MAEFVDYLTCPRNIIDDLKTLSCPYKPDEFSGIKFARQRSASTASPNVFTVRNSVCVAGNDRDSVLFVKKQAYRLLSGKFALESFHIQNDDDIRDGALFVPKIILVAVFQPGRKLIDDDGDEGQLDQVYDEIFEIGAELMVVYMDLPELVYPPDTTDLFHPRMEQLVFPDQKVIKSLASHGLFITMTENRRRLNSAQEQRMLEWLLKPVDPKTHPIFRACALNNREHQGREDVCPLKIGHQSSYDKDKFYENVPTAGTSWISDKLLKTRLEPNLISHHSPPTSSDEELEREDPQDFMRSMESYPLLKRTSKSGKKKALNRQKSKDADGKSKSGGSFYHYGSVVTEDGHNAAKHKEIFRVSPI